MAPKRPRDPKAGWLAARLDRAAEIVPSIRAHLDEQRRHLITISVGQGGTRTGDHADPTLRAVMELERLRYWEGVIDDALMSIEVGVNLLDAECRNALGHRAPSELHQLCGGGNPSTWGSPDCGRHVSYKLGAGAAVAVDPDGLCDEHRIAKNAYDARAVAATKERRRYHRE